MGRQVWEYEEAARLEEFVTLSPSYFSVKKRYDENISYGYNRVKDLKVNLKMLENTITPEEIEEMDYIVQKGFSTPFIENYFSNEYYSEASYETTNYFDESFILEIFSELSVEDMLDCYCIDLPKSSLFLKCLLRSCFFKRKHNVLISRRFKKLKTNLVDSFPKILTFAIMIQDIDFIQFLNSTCSAPVKKKEFEGLVQAKTFNSNTFRGDMLSISVQASIQEWDYFRCLSSPNVALKRLSDLEFIKQVKEILFI